MSKISVFRTFCRIICGALFALSVTFTINNAFASGYSCVGGLEPGDMCSNTIAYPCAEGCYCPGVSGNHNCAWSTGALASNCADTVGNASPAQKGGEEICSYAFRCPNGFPNSVTGSSSYNQCWGSIADGMYRTSGISMKDYSDYVCPAGYYCPGDSHVYYKGTNRVHSRYSCSAFATSSEGATYCTCRTGYSGGGGTSDRDGSNCTANTYNISYVMNGGADATSGQPTTYTYGVGATINGTPTRANSVFEGWCTDSRLTNCSATQTISTTTTGNKTFYAKWSCVNNGYVLSNNACVSNQYTVTLNKNGGSGNITVGSNTYTGSTNATITCYYDTWCNLPSASSLEQNSYVYFTDSWSTDPKCEDGGSRNIKVSSDTTYYACKRVKYSAVLYVHGLDYDYRFYERRGIEFFDVVNDVPTTITSIPVPSPNGDRVFLGYYDEYNYYKSDVYDVIESGVADNSVIVVSKTGQILADTNNWTSANTSDGDDAYLWPVWGCSAGQYITGFNYVNSTNDTNYDDMLVADCANCSPGYSSSGETTECTQDTFTISYTMNGGTNYNGAPTSYTYGVGATIDGTPTRDGYTFAGWCADSGLTNCNTTQTISTTETGNKTFYAKWLRNITIHFDNNPESDSTIENVPDDLTCVEGESCRVYYIVIRPGTSPRPGPKRVGYRINGYNSAQNGSGTSFEYGTGTPTFGNAIQYAADLSGVFNLTDGDEITLYAQWDPNTYTVTYDAGTGGSGSIANGTATYDDNFTPATPSSSTITKSHARFIEWEVSNTNDTKAAGTPFLWKYTEDKTFTATWVCDAGYTLNSNTGDCDPCIAGTYKAAEGDQACTACVKGSYTATPASTSCDACQNGLTTSVAGSTSCDIDCENNAHASTWSNPVTWSNNTMTDLCKIIDCVTGYEITEETVQGTYTNICTAKSVQLSYIDSLDNTTIDTQPQMCTYDTNFNLPETPTKEGFRFAGWELIEPVMPVE